MARLLRPDPLLPVPGDRPSCFASRGPGPCSDFATVTRLAAGRAGRRKTRAPNRVFTRRPGKAATIPLHSSPQESSRSLQCANVPQVTWGRSRLFVAGARALRPSTCHRQRYGARKRGSQASSCTAFGRSTTERATACHRGKAQETAIGTGPSACLRCLAGRQSG